jgi:omega-6 fatty acid desaturase (delta-12 desaturase)
MRSETIINESELFMKYKSTYSSAFIDLSIHICCMSSNFFLLWYFRNSWLSVFTIPLLGFMLVRTFIILHDCGHNSYSPNKIINYIIGSISGLFILSPICWSYRHHIHHLTSGNINNDLNFNYNEFVYTNLYEYKQWSQNKRMIYKILRYPFVLFPLVATIYFGILLRANILYYKLTNTKIFKESTIQILFDTLFSNVGIIYLIYWLYKYEILLQYGIATYICVIIGVLIFHNEHTYNPSYVVNNEIWTQKDSGIIGSSLILFPQWFKYFSMGIEYHHIHHMNSKIPGYNLQKYHEEVVSKSNMFDNVVQLSMLDCYNNLWLALYDEDKKKYITIAEADEEIRKIC